MPLAQSRPDQDRFDSAVCAQEIMERYKNRHHVVRRPLACSAPCKSRRATSLQCNCSAIILVARPRLSNMQRAFFADQRMDSGPTTEAARHREQACHRLLSLPRAVLGIKLPHPWQDLLRRRPSISQQDLPPNFHRSALSGSDQRREAPMCLQDPATSVRGVASAWRPGQQLGSRACRRSLSHGEPTSSQPCRFYA